MREIKIFSSVRLDDDVFCVIYTTDVKDFFLPVIVEGDSAYLVE